MYKKLFIPGPTHVRDEILQAQAAVDLQLVGDQHHEKISAPICTHLAHRRQLIAHPLQPGGKIGIADFPKVLFRSGLA